MYSRKSAAFIISFLVVLTPICKSHAEGQDNQNKEGSVLSLVDAEKWAIQNSYDSKISEVFIEGFDQKIKSIGSHRYPKLVVEGSYKYLETVPALTTMSGTVYLGDNKNYSIGPSLVYNLFDGGVLRNTIKSLKKLKVSKELDRDYVHAMVLFAVRLAYLNVLLAEDQLQLAKEGLKLSQTQNLDIKKKRRLGASSELELSLSNRDLFNQKLKWLEAENFLKKAAIDLSKLIFGSGEEKVYVPKRSSMGWGVLVDFDSLEKIIQYLDLTLTQQKKPPAQVSSLEMKVASSRMEADIESSKYWPQLSLKLRSSLDYPNGPQLEEINQNSISVNLTMPIFDWGEISGAKAEKLFQMRAYEEKKAKLERDIFINTQKLKVELENLKAQKDIVNQLVLESTKVADINLKSYKSGRVQFIEVERANVRKFEAQTKELILKGQIFAKLSQWIAISSGGLNE